LEAVSQRIRPADDSSMTENYPTTGSAGASPQGRKLRRPRYNRSLVGPAHRPSTKRAIHLRRPPLAPPFFAPLYRRSDVFRNLRCCRRRHACRRDGQDRQSRLHHRRRRGGARGCVSSVAGKGPHSFHPQMTGGTRSGATIAYIDL